MEPRRPRPPATQPALGPASWLRRHLPPVLGAVAGVLVCLVVLIVLQLTAHSQGPETAAQALCADLSAQDYAATYALLSPREQSQGTSAQFTAAQQELDVLRGKVTHCGYTITQAGSASSNVVISVTRAKGGALSGQVHFVVVGGAWRMDEYDTGVVETQPPLRA